jgi:urea transporter
MKLKKSLQTFRNDILPGVINSYSIIFFLDNKVLAGTIMLVTFFNFWSGFSGLMAVLFTLLVGQSMNLDKSALRSGVYSFNALLVGIGMGAFFDPGLVFFSLLSIAAMLTLLLSVSLGGWFFKFRIPFLSIPFVISFWFVVLPASHFENLGLTQRSIFWMNEMYSVGGNSLLQLFQIIDTIRINELVDIYLRSLSSVFFQNNLIAGLLITIALLYSSRIMFSLSIVGFLAAYVFAHFTGSETASLNYYNIGANYMMVAFAIGGFFNIPSKYSYLWTILLIPLTSLVLLFFYKLFSYIQLPVFSLPFAFVTILFLYFLSLRTKAKNLVLTPLQLNSPEKNLYAYNNNKDRLAGLYYFPFYLPVMGEWTVTQAHDGEFTHQGEWQHAFDFMITDSHSNTFRNSGYQLSDYYCYNKPVFAPADGYVEIIADNVDDNEIGTVNTINNWGNSIVIRHLNGLYSQISHLKKGTFKVKNGEFVQKGDLIAHCGNSGRSPEPHVHFQVQTLPQIGSKTLDYPFAYFYKRAFDCDTLMQFKKPKKGDVVSNITSDSFIFNALNILPDSSIEMKYSINNVFKTEKWETYTDAYNQKYMHCTETNSTAYYVVDGFMFYFTAFYGCKKSLLYYFYLSAYKLFLSNNSEIIIDDTLPLSNGNKSKYLIVFHDFIAPFYNFIKIKFQSKLQFVDKGIRTGTVIFETTSNLVWRNKSINSIKSTITITENGLREFEFVSDKIKIKAECTN